MTRAGVHSHVELRDSETRDGIRDTLVMHLVDGEDEVSSGQLT